MHSRKMTEMGSRDRQKEYEKEIVHLTSTIEGLTSRLNDLMQCSEGGHVEILYRKDLELAEMKYELDLMKLKMSRMKKMTGGNNNTEFECPLCLEMSQKMNVLVTENEKLKEKVLTETEDHVFENSLLREGKMPIHSSGPIDDDNRSEMEQIVSVLENSIVELRKDNEADGAVIEPILPDVEPILPPDKEHTALRDERNLRSLLLEKDEEIRALKSRQESMGDIGQPGKKGFEVEKLRTQLLEKEDVIQVLKLRESTRGKELEEKSLLLESFLKEKSKVEQDLLSMTSFISEVNAREQVRPEDIDRMVGDNQSITEFPFPELTNRTRFEESVVGDSNTTAKTLELYKALLDDKQAEMDLKDERIGALEGKVAQLQETPHLGLRSEFKRLEDTYKTLSLKHHEEIQGYIQTIEELKDKLFENKRLQKENEKKEGVIEQFEIKLDDLLHDQERSLDRIEELDQELGGKGVVRRALSQQHKVGDFGEVNRGSSGHSQGGWNPEIMQLREKVTVLNNRLKSLILDFETTESVKMNLENQVHDLEDRLSRGDHHFSISAKEKEYQKINKKMKAMKKKFEKKTAEFMNEINEKNSMVWKLKRGNMKSRRIKELNREMANMLLFFKSKIEEMRIDVDRK